MAHKTAAQLGFGVIIDNSDFQKTLLILTLALLPLSSFHLSKERRKQCLFIENGFKIIGL